METTTLSDLSPFLHLPPEMHRELFLFLDYASLLQLRLVNSLLYSEIGWFYLYVKLYGRPSEEMLWIFKTRIFQDIDWEKVFRIRSKVGKRMELPTISTLEGKENDEKAEILLQASSKLYGDATNFRLWSSFEKVEENAFLFSFFYQMTESLLRLLYNILLDPEEEEIFRPMHQEALHAYASALIHQAQMLRELHQRIPKDKERYREFIQRKDSYTNKRTLVLDTSTQKLNKGADELISSSTKPSKWNVRIKEKITTKAEKILLSKSSIKISSPPPLASPTSSPFPSHGAFHMTPEEKQFMIDTIGFTYDRFKWLLHPSQIEVMDSLYLEWDLLWKKVKEKSEETEPHQSSDLVLAERLIQKGFQICTLIETFRGSPSVKDLQALGCMELAHLSSMKTHLPITEDPQSLEWFEKAIKILEEMPEDNGFRWYNLACIQSLLGQLEKCRESLLKAYEGSQVVPRTKLTQDPDLQNARETSWWAGFIGDTWQAATRYVASGSAVFFAYDM